MANVTLRPCRLEDAGAIALLNLTSLGQRLSADKTRGRLEVILQSPTHNIIVAEEGSRVVGYMHEALYLQTFTAAFAEVICLAVHSDSRKAGVGRMLMEAAEAWAREQETQGVWLTSIVERGEAHAFYEAIGYTHVQDRKAFKKLFTPEEPLGQG